MNSIFKILFLFFSTYIFVFAGGQNLFSALINKEPLPLINNRQRAINTLADYNQLVSSLKNAIRMGDESKAYILGTVYLQDFNLADGHIKANYKEAIKYFNISLRAGYGFAALQIAMLKYDFNTPDIYDALDILEKGISKPLTDDNAKASLALAYSALVLDKLNSNIKYVRKAISILYPEAMNHNLATLDYVLANLLNIDGEVNKANKFLNSACNNPKSPSTIRYMCARGSQIIMKDKRSGKIIKKKNSMECKNGQIVY